MESTIERLNRIAAERNFQEQTRQAAQQQRIFDNRWRQYRDDKAAEVSRRQQTAYNSYRGPGARQRTSPAYDHPPVNTGSSAPMAFKYKILWTLGLVAALLTILVFYTAPQISGQFRTGTGHAVIAVGAGLIAGFITLVIVGIIIPLSSGFRIIRSCLSSSAVWRFMPGLIFVAGHNSTARRPPFLALHPIVYSLRSL